MASPVIQVENLGKRYRIGVRESTTTLNRWQAIGATLRAPFTYLLDSLRAPTEEETLWAIRDVSFEVKRGEVLGIIGRNGAGKSTLLKILSRITDPTEGRAVMRGRIGSLLEVGTGFHPDLSARENIYLKGTILGMKKWEIDSKLDEIIEFAEIGRFLDTPVKRYSSGMGVRLGFAVAAHLEPEILIVDEVLAVGDAAFQSKCIGKMTGIAQSGRTILFVSHNIPTVMQLCSRALLLQDGRVAFDGDPIEIAKEYLRGALQRDGEVVWAEDQAPGEHGLLVRGVRIAFPDGRLAPVVRVDEPFQVVVYYQILEPNLSTRCAVKFYTQSQLAFTSVEPVESKRLAPGIYSTRVNVPPHLLNEGEYTIGLSFFQYYPVKRHFAMVKETVSFQVFDPMNGDSARGDYTQHLGGLVSPRLHWQLAQPDVLTTFATTLPSLTHEPVGATA